MIRNLKAAVQSPSTISATISFSATTGKFYNYQISYSLYDFYFVFLLVYRYEFKSAKKAALRELGPRFTLRLKWMQKGTFDTIEGEYEWIIAGKRHEMETSRRRFFL